MAKRTHPNVARMLDAMRGVRDVNAQYQQIESLVAAGEYAPLHEFAEALERRDDLGAETWAREAVFDRIVRALALHQGIASASLAIVLSAMPRKHTVQLPRSAARGSRELASLLAAGQSVDILSKVLLEKGISEAAAEVLSCWIQELVVRGTDLEAHPQVQSFWQELGEKQHPLAILPLRLFPAEECLRDWLPRVHLDGSSCSTPFGPSQSKRARPSVMDVHDWPACCEQATSSCSAAAVVNWREESNGKIEARSFRFTDAIASRAITPQALVRLSLTCLEGTKPQDVLLYEVVTKKSFGILFSAAANGGAYNHGHKAAYGRLFMWESIAGLTESVGRSIEAIAQSAEQWSWFVFEADSSWFEQVAWDLGIAALSPESAVLSILAATDTD